MGSYSWVCVYISAMPGSHELHGSPLLLQRAPWGSSPAQSFSKAVLGPWACAVSLPDLACECSWPLEFLLPYECTWPCGFLFKALISLCFKLGEGIPPLRQNCSHSSPVKPELASCGWTNFEPFRNVQMTWSKTVTHHQRKSSKRYILFFGILTANKATSSWH